MGRIMPTHNASRYAGLPSLEQIEPLIERTDVAPHHWYWLGAFTDNGEMRVAVLRHEGGTFTVVRMLWQLVKNVVLTRRSLRNECGLVTCVNPDHFSLVEPKSGRFSLPDNCELPGGDKANIVRADFTTTHVLIEGAERYICDRKRVPATKVVMSGIEITCKRCLSAWQSLGRPLVQCS